QANTTSGLGLDKQNLSATVYDLLLGQKRPDQVITPTAIKNLEIIPTNVELAGAEIEMISMPDREYILKRILVDMKYIYDYILIDCPPSLSVLTVNALVASDTILVPIQCEYFALEGLSQLMYTIDLIKKRLNKRLQLEGVVFTMYDPRTNLSADVVKEVKNHLADDSIYKSIIPRNVRLSEAPSHGLPITLYDAKSKGSEAYRALAQEVIDRKVI
ncbi:MAG: AAA family ATPase, partial [Defluviitaleaceae bacterium]|nr:AAA family ATPase [Defluviitaleaceae bacterium]